MMTDYKRRPESVDEGSLTCSEAKRQKTDFSISPKERKEKFGERIAALQQLVSPFGKTDTASVLLEAMEYIKFLHDQVQVLSAPYLRSTRKIQESEQYSLSSRGLCLVPISRTLSVVRSNGADIWAPIKASSPSSKMPRPNFIDMVSTGISRQA
ncbi:PREDICTED: transcription factor bHLH113 [Nelumbo nucifera]|uniref:Transcription factor bHLH113 n=1 Tax=Nelumbo nucifera TaxID=4432 RepID=A0A1U8AKE9_NELNU|nr:PREDICTED: transcription factor bHLH113 [Nelumbo nucifera]XP_010268190.1 PREDICTED: transcription factor bHLH113 [Nelumbo nucifera]XP_010268191.1 PREDICTED: transcription factor bHLH113 [Nelumbo nucifera]XP_010268192.1 PREDICTED: transcription factor bHLH113 [Nelumbo nucifera]